MDTHTSRLARRFAPVVIRILLLVLSVTVLFGCVIPVQDPAPLFERALRRNEEWSIGYCIELNRKGVEPSKVNEQLRFLSGDGLRICLKSTKPVYAQLESVGSTGHRMTVFPRSGDNSQLESGRENLLPPHGTLVMDDNTGRENLLLIVSTKPLRSLDTDYLPGQLRGHRSADGYTYLMNLDSGKPVCIPILLYHLGTQQTSSSARVKYDVRSIRADTESSTSISGFRDQFVEGLNHLYVNHLCQRLYGLYYVQEGSLLSESLQKAILFSVAFRFESPSTGERLKENGFTGENFLSGGIPIANPGPAATIDGIAAEEENLSGKPTMVVGECLDLNIGGVQAVLPVASSNNRVFRARTAKELDELWQSNNGEPLIAVVWCQSRLFGGVPGGHVVVLSERRERGAKDLPCTGQSHYEYHVLNSWGPESNGWASSEAIAFAMNYSWKLPDPAEPLKKRGSSKEPDFTGLLVARPDRGLALTGEEVALFKTPLQQLDRQSPLNRGGASSDQPDMEDYGTRIKAEADELRAHVSNQAAELSPLEQLHIYSSIQSILAGGSRPPQFRLFDKQKASILHDANRLFKDEAKVLSQGLGKFDRNKALIALLRDTDDPELMNQGLHNTCNVTAIAKLEALRRPATQVRRFVDMYTNIFGDGTAE